MFVTGVGIVTSLGFGWDENSRAFRQGNRNFRPVTLFDASRHRAKTAAEIDIPNDLPAGKLSRRAVKRLDRASKLLLLAADEAWRSAAINGPKTLPIILGTTSGGMASGEHYYRSAMEQPLTSRGQPTRLLNYLAESQPMTVAAALGISGPIRVIANACASGSNAVGHAAELIRRGRAEIVLTGGYDALSEMVFTGFDSLQLLSQTQCRPFDAARDGLALGEGAAVFVLESEDHANRRKARALAELRGYGAATDIHHLTQPHPQGDAALASMRMACEAAGIEPHQVNYINAHGTGTPLNDASEAAAISRWAGDRAPSVKVSSTKAGIGHLLGAAGAVEAAVCVMALHGQWLPPSPNVGTADAQCRFEIVRKPADARLDYVLSNSFGFGGANATLVLRRAQ